MTPRFAAYLTVVIAGLVAGALLLSPRLYGVFSCSAQGYSPNRYLAYCDGTRYGDYDHGAFEYGLEKASLEYAARADAVFLGNSRMLMAFSTSATDDWFRSHASSYYLLGFTYDEKMPFIREQLDRLKPRARLYVINLDHFFKAELSEPAALVTGGMQAAGRYRTKRRWQVAHRYVCGHFPVACGHKFAFFRAVDTGAYLATGGNLTPGETGDDEGPDADDVQRQIQLAEPLLRNLGVPRDCVVFTVAPYEHTPLAAGRAIAAALGVSFVAPEASGFQTSDGSHLDSASAERWTTEFFRQAEPQLQKCLSKTGLPE